ncbi:hypothetical protein V8C35DRAFT_282219 [Trichoderma chlorosporum]
MSHKRRTKSLEEVELELEYFGLSRQSAAAIVRLANNLKQTRKLRAAHIELLTPGRRLHPPSPLGQIVWNQSDIVTEIESPNHHDNEGEDASRNEASRSEVTTITNAISDFVLSSIESVTLADTAPSIDGFSIPQDFSPLPSKISSDVRPAVAEEDDKHDDEHEEEEDSRWWR